MAIALTGDPNYERIDVRTGEVFDGLKPPYTTMSRKPGIGKGWIDKYRSDVYPHDYVVDQNMHKSRPPNFYDNQLSEEELEALKAQRASRASAHSADQTPDRLRDRETCHAAKIQSLQRT